MPCDPWFGRGDRVVGIVCGVRGKKPKVGPCACGRPGEVLCDGPGATTGKTCDTPLCKQHALSIRCTNVDFCPKCAALPTEPNLCAVSTTAVPCRGPFIEEESCCLTHAKLFDFWAARRGGELVYADSALTREQKRDRFREWLNKLNEAAVAFIVRPGPLPKRKPVEAVHG